MYELVKFTNKTNVLIAGMCKVWEGYKYITSKVFRCILFEQRDGKILD